MTLVKPTLRLLVFSDSVRLKRELNMNKLARHWFRWLGLEKEKIDGLDDVQLKKFAP